MSEYRKLPYIDMGGIYRQHSQRIIVSRLTHEKKVGHHILGIAHSNKNISRNHHYNTLSVP